jgi:hypothetical protein
MYFKNNSDQEDEDDKNMKTSPLLKFVTVSSRAGLELLFYC